MRPDNTPRSSHHLILKIMKSPGILQGCFQLCHIVQRSHLCHSVSFTWIEPFRTGACVFTKQTCTPCTSSHILTWKYLQTEDMHLHLINILSCIKLTMPMPKVYIPQTIEYLYSERLRQFPPSESSDWLRIWAVKWEIRRLLRIAS